MLWGLTRWLIRKSQSFLRIFRGLSDWLTRLVEKSSLLIPTSSLVIRRARCIALDIFLGNVSMIAWVSEQLREVFPDRDRPLLDEFLCSGSQSGTVIPSLDFLQ